MRGSTLIGILVMLPMVGAEPIPISFQSPMDGSGSLEVFTVDWALFIFENESAWAKVDFPPHKQTTYKEYQIISRQDLPINQTIPLHSAGISRQELKGHMSSLGSSSGISSLYVEGQVHLQISGEFELATFNPQDCPTLFVAAGRHEERAARYDALCPRSEIVISARQPSVANLNASVIRILETHNWNFSCANCLEGPDRRTQTMQLGRVTTAITELTFHRLETDAGIINVTGYPSLVIAGSLQPINTEIDGILRMPLARGICETCLRTENTWTVEGKTALDNLRRNEWGHFSGEMEGASLTIKLDETPAPEISEILTDGRAVAASAAIGGALACLKWLIAPLFTRLSKEKALEHPRRKAIFEYIQLHPGANFREIARETGIAAGTVRHHLNVLGRSELVVEHQHGSTVRLFENQAKFNQNWADLVLLREPALGQLYDWLKENSGAPQKAVLEGMDELGWSRSTTQHRLSRLVEGGLATIKLQGRLKLYSVVDRSKAVPPPSPGPSGMTRPGLNTA